MNGFKWSISGAVGAAVAASACCTIPLALVSAGIGGAWVSNLVALEPYRPLFIGLAALLFGIAIVQVKRSSSETDCDCEDGMNNTSKVLLLSFGAIAALGLILSPEFLPLSDSASTTGNPVTAESVDFQEVTLAVDGMTCETCTTTVHKALSNLNGVFEVVVTYEPAIAVVRFDANRVGMEDFERASRHAGYPATAVNNTE